ncbi:MAG: acyclic terpene utilization AtuA family protein [Pseudomonadota bacterium]|nr:acyclic terpene utilization AtuA family protein [Pseudomonadota bacterium]
MSIRVLIPAGALGLGYDKEALKRGLEKKPHLIAIDGGSTDSGPAYLGRGVSKYSRASTKLEWKGLMEARERARVPLVIGTAGTCGTDKSVDWFLKITEEIASELSLSLKVAVLKCSQKNESIAKSYSHGMIKPLPNAPKISERIILNCTNIVALAGVEQIILALKENPDIIIAGRATDTAIIAALPIMKGLNPGLAWHGAKVSECGALCTTNPMSGVVLVQFNQNSFTVEPMSKNARATPRTVSAHMLYENANPFILYEPGGHLNVEKANYTAISDRVVQVSGAQWIASADYTVKLEGVVRAGFQNVILTLIRDRKYVRDVDIWIKQVEDNCCKLIDDRLSLSKNSYSLEFRLIGKNASFGTLETSVSEHLEIGIMALITAETQQDADEISRILNPLLLHHPLTQKEELPTFAFPFSPAHISRGPVYEFMFNHILSLKNPMDAFELEVLEYG